MLNYSSNTVNTNPCVVRKLLLSITRNNCISWLELLERNLWKKSEEQNNIISVRIWRRCSSSTDRRLWVHLHHGGKDSQGNCRWSCSGLQAVYLSLRSASPELIITDNLWTPWQGLSACHRAMVTHWNCLQNGTVQRDYGFVLHGLRKGPHCSSLGNLSWDATVKWQNISDLCSLLLHTQDIIPGKYSMPADFNVYYDIFSLVCFCRRWAESAGFTEVSTARCRQVFSLTPYCGVGGLQDFL